MSLPPQFPHLKLSDSGNAHLESLLRQAEANRTKPVAIVDMKGKLYERPSGKMSRITAKTSPLKRFDVRTRQECRRDGLEILYRNRTWRVAAEAERAAKAKEASNDV